MLSAAPADCDDPDLRSAPSSLAGPATGGLGAIAHQRNLELAANIEGYQLRIVARLFQQRLGEIDAERTER